jgi:hypothetical protein
MPSMSPENLLVGEPQSRFEEARSRVIQADIPCQGRGLCVALHCKLDDNRDDEGMGIPIEYLQFSSSCRVPRWHAISSTSLVVVNNLPSRSSTPTSVDVLSEVRRIRSGLFPYSRS